jgi:hypothetical protein
MSTINVILAPSADGTLHLPVPAEWRDRAIKVKAEMEPVAESSPKLPASESLKGFGCLKGKIWMAPDFDDPLEDFKDYMG